MQHIVLQIKDITGKTVVTLIDKNFNAGEHTFQWTPVNLPKGIYIAVLQNGDTTLSQKLLYL